MTSHNLKELRVAGILDELSCFCFPYECKFLELDIVNYIERMEEFKPQLLFIESAWHGLKNHWYTKVYNLSIEIREILIWCREHKVPTVFWNKEDPVHFDTFFGVASWFDWVYTTDMDCVPLYKRLLKHNRVGVLPFATSPYSFNPIEKYERKPKSCFAGGWYALQPERCVDFEKIFDLCSEILGIDIYDRNVYPGNPDYTFPDKYKESIVGSLPMNKIDIAYKGYECGITMNTVKRSSTMEARRIYELLACNTISMSNPCSAIKNMFGDLVIVWEDENQFREELEKIKNTPNYKEKLTLAALRKVMLQHTYEERLAKICEDALGWEKEKKAEKICVFSVVGSAGEVNRVLRNWKRQKHLSELILILKETEKISEIENIRCIDLKEYDSIVSVIDADWYCYFSTDNYYGENYLTDYIVATKYSSAPIIGKGSYFKNISGTYLLEKRQISYSEIDSIKCDRCMVKKHIAQYCYNCGSDLEKESIQGFEALSIDFFNFCEGEHGAECKIVEDIKFNEGHSMNEIYNICRQLPNQKYFTMQEQMSGKEFLLNAVWDFQNVWHCEFPEECIGIYALENDGRKIYMQATSEYKIDKYAQDGYIRIFLDGTVRGEVQFRLSLLDEKGKIVRNIWHKIGMYLRCPVPDNAVSFYYTLVMEEHSSALLREVVINAFPGTNIGMEKWKEI